ncbi:MAG: beta-galactosidase [Victivallales bacterium]|nr:beta-galactosidase [Victivallales bacterium]
MLMNQPIPEEGNAIYACTLDPLKGLSGYTFLEKLQPVNSRAVKQTIAGLGMETLDRETFDPAPLYDPIAETGCKYIRLQTGWLRSEKEPGKYDFTWLDDIVDNLLERNLVPWFSASFGNPLYTPVPEWDAEFARCKALGIRVPNGMIRGYIGETPFYHGEAAMAAWCHYLQAMATHFAGRVNIYEIWNEPDLILASFWRHNGKHVYADKPDVERFCQCARDYAAFTRQSARALREVNPNLQIAADLSNTRNVYPQIFAEEHLDDDIDILTYHNYSNTPESFSLQRTEALRAMLFNRPGARLKELWQGESGRATKPHHGGFNVCTEYNMAKFIVRRLYTDAVSGVKVSSIFTASELNQYYPDGSTQEFGIFKADPCRPKLGAFAFQGMCKMLSGLTYAPQDQIAVGTPHGGLLASRLNYQVMAHAFRRNGIPVFGIYLPENLEIGVVPTPAEVVINTDYAFDFSAPVVVDPLRQNVYAISKELISRPTWAYGAIVLNPFHFTDYPLFITDRKALEDSSFIHL